MQGERRVALRVRARKEFWVRWIVFNRNVEVIGAWGLVGLNLNIKRGREQFYEVLGILRLVRALRLGMPQ